MTATVVVLGIFNADTTYRADRMPVPGETVMGRGFALGPGGKGSNQAVAAARAGARAHLVTRLGDDDFARMARAIWAEAGVIPEVTVDAESHTGAAFIFVDAATGENAIIVVPGAGDRIAPADLDLRAGLIGGAQVFLCQLEQPLEAARRGLRIARAAGVRTILNPAPAAALPDDLLALVDILTPNETEAATLSGLAVTGRAGAEAAARALRARGVGAVAVTLGADGVLWHDGTRTLHVPAPQVGPVVETTGAGDCFNGALAVALAEGQGIEPALRFACAAAALSVTRAGAAASMPDRARIDALLGR